MDDRPDRERADSFYQEIQTLRKRCHQLSESAGEFQGKVMLWQQTINAFVDECRMFMRKYGPIVDTMRDADLIAKALEDNTRAQRANARAISTFRLSRGQFCVAAVVSGAAVTDLVLRLIG